MVLNFSFLRFLQRTVTFNLTFKLALPCRKFVTLFIHLSFEILLSLDLGLLFFDSVVLENSENFFASVDVLKLINQFLLALMRSLCSSRHVKEAAIALRKHFLTLSLQMDFPSFGISENCIGETTNLTREFFL